VPLTKPKFAILDTATISKAAKFPNDVQVKELLKILRGGNWIPFITFHHLEEASFGNLNDFKKRFDFLRSLPCVSYLALPENKTVVGKWFNVQTHEIEFLAAHPNATHNEIIEAVRPKVCSGFGTGEQVVNFSFWENYRKNEASKRQPQLAELSNITHFPTFDINEKIPDKDEIIDVCSRNEASLRAKEQASQLARQIYEDGDCRGINPQTTASNYMQEVMKACRDEDFVNGKYSYEEFLESAGVKRDRLPPSPTQKDFFHEAAFIKIMEIHAKYLLKNKEELLNCVRKEQLPSWVVMEKLHQEIVQMKKSEIGNVNDTNIAAFGLYVDMFNVDKRIADNLQKASRKNSLLLQVFSRVPNKPGFIGVLDALKN
jgi:hypothetical protein